MELCRPTEKSLTRKVSFPYRLLLLYDNKSAKGDIGVKGRQKLCEKGIKKSFLALAAAV